WPLTMFAATRARFRWFLIAVVASCCLLLPDGSGFTKLAQVPASFLMTGVVVWVVVRGFGWLRGYEPTEIDFDALRAEHAAVVRPVPAAAPTAVVPVEP